MAKKITAKDKIFILEHYFLPTIKGKMAEAIKALVQAQEDWLILNSSDGDKSKVVKKPILSVIDGEVCAKTVDKLIADMERMLME